MNKESKVADMDFISALLKSKNEWKSSNVLFLGEKEILAALDEHENIIAVGKARACISSSGILAAEDWEMNEEKQSIEVLYLIPADVKPGDRCRISEIESSALPLPPDYHVGQIVCQDNVFTISSKTGKPSISGSYAVIDEQLSSAAHTYYTRGIAVNVLERYYYEFLAERHQLYLREERAKQKRRERQKQARQAKEKFDMKLMQETDKDFAMGIDAHLSELQYQNHVCTKTGYIFREGRVRVGLMHYCILWDNLPFLNFIYVIETHRNKGIASKAMKAWEEEMKKQGYSMVLLSTQVNEEAQHLYRKLGYIECGALLLNNTPLEQPMEMFMRKVL